MLQEMIPEQFRLVFCGRSSENKGIQTRNKNTFYQMMTKLLPKDIKIEGDLTVKSIVHMPKLKKDGW